MLEIGNTVLIIVDVQGKLAQLMHEKELLSKNVRVLIQACQILKIPIIWCQQTPAALGPTVPEIAELLAGVEPIDKASFSCCGNGDFNSKLNALSRKSVLLCGIETHVCVYQTAADLVKKGYQVDVIADAVSSRTAENKRTGLKRIAECGASISSMEMALFELLRTAEHPQFKQIARLVK
jgi:nicotinamidase-related amidase